MAILDAANEVRDQIANMSEYEKRRRNKNLDVLGNFHFISRKPVQEA